MTDRIELRGLKVLAYCGALPEEQLRRQPFEIDIDIETDLTLAAHSDSLDDTVDYGPVCDAVIDVVNEQKFMLIEKMAQTFVDRIFSCDTRIEAIDLTLRKLRPPVPIDISTAAVKIYRTRQ